MALRFFVIIRFAHDFRHRLSITKQVCFCIRLALKLFGLRPHDFAHVRQ